jgi:hypothetical protein
MKVNASRVFVEAVLVCVLGWDLFLIGAWSVVGVGLALVLAWLFWLGLSTSGFKILKWTSLIGAGLAVIGLTGISLAIHTYPNSNLLGGWGLVFGPIYWLGGLMSLIAAIAWIAVGLSWLWRRKAKDAA